MLAVENDWRAAWRVRESGPCENRHPVDIEPLGCLEYLQGERLTSLLR